MQQLYKSKHFKTVLIIIFIILSIIGWQAIQFYEKYYISTDDAYINANVITIAPRVTGKVIAVGVVNNQLVDKNQILLNLDTAPFLANVASAKAQVAMAEAKLTKANLTSGRVFSLVKRKFLSAQSGDDAVAIQKTAEAELNVANAALLQAKLQLEYTKVVAPKKGWITNFSVRPGDIVTANRPLFSIVNNDEFWIDANFKETEIGKIRPGQVASIVADMYPGEIFKGVVESISSGTGAIFSLLPPQNATGNWVKITQRVPVRIRVLNPNSKYPLRIGTSTTVTIHLQEYVRPHG